MGTRYVCVDGEDGTTGSCETGLDVEAVLGLEEGVLSAAEVVDHAEDDGEGCDY